MRRLAYIIFLSAILSAHCLGTATHLASVHINNGFVVLSASVNGVNGIYILDSGAPGLILNSLRHNLPTSESKAMQSIHGFVNASELEHWSFTWNSFQVEGTMAHAIDLSYLETALNCEIAGLVGIDLFKGYHVLIDYSNQRLELWEEMPAMFSQSPYVELPVEMQGHVPVVTLYKGSKALKLGLDCGAESNLIDQSVIRKWKHGLQNLGKISLTGADQKVVYTEIVAISGLTTRGTAIPSSPFVVTDLSFLKSSEVYGIDGLLGQPFFYDRSILIDRDRKFLRLSPLQSSSNNSDKDIRSFAAVDE